MTSWQLRNNKCKRKCSKKPVPTKLALPPCAYACATNLASGICPCLKMPSFVAVKHSSTALSCGVSVALQLCVWERHLQARLVALDTTKCHQNESIFSCNCCCPYKKTGWLIGFIRWCSVLCEQWLVCHPCSRSLTLTVLYSSTFQLLGTNPLQFRESRNTFLEVWTFAMRNMSDAIFIIHHWDWQLLKPASINSISLDNQDPAAEGCRRGQFTIHVSVRSDDCPYCPWLDVVMPFSMSVGLAEALWLPSGYHCFTRYSRQHGHGEKSFWDLDLEICRHLPSFVGFRATIS